MIDSRSNKEMDELKGLTEIPHASPFETVLLSLSNLLSCRRTTLALDKGQCCLSPMFFTYLRMNRS